MAVEHRLDPLFRLRRWDRLRRQFLLLLLRQRDLSFPLLLRSLLLLQSLLLLSHQRAPSLPLDKKRGSNSNSPGLSQSRA